MNYSKRTWEDFEEEKDVQSSHLNKIGTQDLIGKFKSKLDLYIYLTEILGYYLPQIEVVNRDFLRQILKGEKKLLKMNEVKLTKVPKYEELSIKALMKSLKDEKELFQYFPDINEKSKPIERQYFFNIINTIQPEYLSHIVKQSQDRRNNPQNEQGKQDFILVSDEWINQLTQHPFVSKRNGRTLQLLKSSQKFVKARKPKELKPSVISLKRFKGLENGGSALKQNKAIMNETNMNFQESSGSLFNENQTQNMRFNI